VSQCNIYFPGLLGPDVSIEALDKNEWPNPRQHPHLARLLARGQYSQLRKADLESRVLNGLGVSFSPDNDAPIARLRTQQIPHLTPQKKVWCLDPVFIQVDKEDAVICAHDSIELTENEALHLIEDLNAHFVDDGFKLHYHSVSRWVLEAELELVTRSLSSAMHKNLSQVQPAGESEKRWRALLNEIQMLLFNHHVNQAREEQGAIPANSLWLWGGGESEQYEQVIETVYCNDGWIHDLAKIYEINTQFIDKFSLPNKINAPCLIVYTDHLEAIRNNDAFAWLDSLKQFEEKILAEATRLLMAGTFDNLNVYSDTVAISTQRKDLKKWWRRIKPIHDSMIKTRDGYGI